jgi:hypothetical protein
VWPSRGAASETTEPKVEPEVYQAWPFDAAEAKRRQEETAKRLGIPVERTLDLGPSTVLGAGNGVKLELVLIPAGRFFMGTPEPEPVDEEGFRRTILTGQVILGSGGGALLVLLTVVLIRAIRRRQRPQYSLARFLAMAEGLGLDATRRGTMFWHKMGQTHGGETPLRHLPVTPHSRSCCKSGFSKMLRRMALGCHFSRIRVALQPVS